MKRIVQFSGGKDSTALVLWAREHFGDDFIPMFCDVKWEHPLTMSYIDYIDRTVLGGRLVRVTSRKYPEGMRELIIVKGRVPSAKARFCTDELKIQATVEYLATLDDEAVIYQGVRADESDARRDAGPRLWSDRYDAWVNRPLFHWTAEMIFEFHDKHKVDVNPLYRLGAGRVGCFPCVMMTLSELKRFSQAVPEVWDRARELESLSKGTFFPPDYIPFRFCSRQLPSKRKKGSVGVATVDDVQRYLEGSTMAQIALFDTRRPSGCVSAYNICE